MLCWLDVPAPAVATTVAEAVGRLGGAMVLANPAVLVAARVGTIENAARVLSRLGDMIVLGGLSQRDITRFAVAADVPVLNAFSDDDDPCRALADLADAEGMAPREDPVGGSWPTGWLRPGRPTRSAAGQPTPGLPGGPLRPGRRAAEGRPRLPC